MKTLEDRMKRYEAVTDFLLPIRQPVIIRLDGWHFKSFTKGLKKPFDLVFRESMLNTMYDLCKEIPGVVLGYTQSDEISLVVCDYKTLESTSWFNNRVGKILSIATSIASVSFNRHFKQLSKELDDQVDYSIKYDKAYFDARVFTLPKDEVTNYLYWRQCDAIRNSVSTIAQTHLGKQMIYKKNNQDKLDLLGKENIYLDDFELWLIRGACLVKKEVSEKQCWTIDKNIPIFIDKDRIYVENIII